MNYDNYLCKIKVTNLKTKAVFIHRDVPREHVQMLTMNPNLDVDVMGSYRNFNNGYKNSRKIRSNTNS